MTDIKKLKQRIGVIVELIKQSDTLGRTALMKLIYFLQELKGINLGYQFRIYTYGPFDSSVLDDLSYAESLKIVESEIESFPNGYSYKYKVKNSNENIIPGIQDYLEENRESIEWVSNEFGNNYASELELLSTIVYVDKLYNQKEEQVSIEEIRETVKKIKSHFTDDHILNSIKDLKTKGLLNSVN